MVPLANHCKSFFSLAGEIYYSQLLGCADLLLTIFDQAHYSGRHSPRQPLGRRVLATGTALHRHCLVEKLLNNPHRTYKHPTLIVALLPVLVPLLFCEDVVADDVEFANEERINKMHTRTTVLQGENGGKTRTTTAERTIITTTKGGKTEKNAIELARFFLPKKRDADTRVAARKVTNKMAKRCC